MFMNINNISPSMPSMSMPNISGEGSDKLKSLEQKLQQLETEKQKEICRIIEYKLDLGWRLLFFWLNLMDWTVLCR